MVPRDNEFYLSCPVSETGSQIRSTRSVSQDSEARIDRIQSGERKNQSDQRLRRHSRFSSKKFVGRRYKGSVSLIFELTESSTRYE